MKKLYLASSIDVTASGIAKDIGKNPKKLRLAFIFTAAEPEKGNKDWLRDDRGGLLKAGFGLFDYTITGKTVKDFQNDLQNVDIIHVNGGNTFYLLLQARKSGFDKWIMNFVETGGIYTGSSAGSIIAAPNIEPLRILETKIYEKKLKTYNAFGLVDFIIFPHWGSRDFKNSYLNHRVDFAYKPENKIILLNDRQYVKVENDMYRIEEVPLLKTPPEADTK